MYTRCFWKEHGFACPFSDCQLFMYILYLENTISFILFIRFYRLNKFQLKDNVNHDSCWYVRLFWKHVMLFKSANILITFTRADITTISRQPRCPRPLFCAIIISTGCISILIDNCALFSVDKLFYFSIFFFVSVGTVFPTIFPVKI